VILELCHATVENYCRGEYNGMVPTDLQALYQMADGLHFIHSKNLAHRDISTGNVLIKLTGDGGVVMKIADFGVCKSVSENGSLSMSGNGHKGTITFMAPELLKQMHQTDERDCASNESQSRKRGHISNDIFSLGCVFYRFLTKNGHPFMEPVLNDYNRITSNILANNQFMERK
jgi:serine/threonine protein kinase